MHCIARQINTVNAPGEFVADPDFDIKLPALFRMLLEDAITDTDVKACVQTFAAKFLTSSNRSDWGRYNKPLGSDLQAKMNLLLEKVLGAQHKIVKRENIHVKMCKILSVPASSLSKLVLKELMEKSPSYRLFALACKALVRWCVSIPWWCCQW